MSKPNQRRLGEIMRAPESSLGALVGHARDLARLDTILTGALDAELAGHCRVADLRARRLTLAVDSPPWATRLRYHMSLICEQFRAAGVDVGDARVIVVPVTVPTPARPPTRPRMGVRGAASLESAAAGVTHAPLAAALRRLARNGNG